MPRIVIRAHKNPFSVADAVQTYERNTIGNNTGNLVFSQAVFRLLSRSDTELTTSGLRSSPAARWNEAVDHVVIPLANAFRPDYVASLDAMSTLIEALRVPVSVLGVGAQASLTGKQGARDAVGTATTRFVRAVLERSPSIGVRGEFTRAYLNGLGFGDEHVKVVGCPSMFMYGPDLDVHKKVDALTTDSPIAFNVSPYVAQMGPLSQYCAEHYPHLVYMGQNIQTLELMLYGTYPSKTSTMADNGAPVTLEHPLVAQDRVRFFLDPVTWFDHLRQYDFSFGTRIHGNIAALLAGTPALLLAHDSRTLELAEYHEIPYRLITEVTGGVDPTALYAESSWENLTANHAGRWDVFSTFLAEHHLQHVYGDGQDRGAGFDATLAGVEFPPPVHTLMGAPPADLYAMQRRLHEVEEELATVRADLSSSDARLKAALRSPARTRGVRARAWDKIDRTVRQVARIR